MRRLLFLLTILAIPVNCEARPLMSRRAASTADTHCNKRTIIVAVPTYTQPRRYREPEPPTYYDSVRAGFMYRQFSTPTYSYGGVSYGSGAAYDPTPVEPLEIINPFVK